ncbi:hypothetical protein OCU04_009249 [Sclerotinia nivalis]|uniref:Epoxide hydrolase n=1 Tax=Sclerotinia nivalis TaxID=352851 RepID=A0A9X0DHX9_9HELO|nr:hypothetical protein OCU04_009249 [Sclerotinia nivalis]
MSLFYSLDSDLGKDNLGATGAFRKWLEGSMIAPYPNFVTDEDVASFKALFSPQNGGFGAAKNWYTAQLHGINEANDKAIPKEKAILHQPTLLITSTNYASLSANFASQMKPYVSNLRVENWEAGHWIQLQKSEETNALLGEFFEG